MLKQFPTSQFKKDYKLVMKRGLNLEKLKDVVNYPALKGRGLGEYSKPYVDQPQL